MHERLYRPLEEKEDDHDSFEEENDQEVEQTTQSISSVSQQTQIKANGNSVDTVKVTTTGGAYLFTLSYKNAANATVTAKQVYDAGYQWFEPQADNYLPLISVNPDIAKMSELKHFTWEQIALFANREWSASDFFQGGDGDWKQSAEGADGFFLVTVNGMPYWSDAVGQIPFAAWYAKERIKEHGDKSKAIEETLNKERSWGSGTLLGSRDSDNSYDHYFAMRGAKAATEAYDREGDGTLKLNKTFSPSNSSLGKSISAEDAKTVKKTAEE